MAASALLELELVLELFAKGASQSARARQAYVSNRHSLCGSRISICSQGILRDLKSKADRSYQQYRNRHASPALDIQLNLGPEAEITASRLAIFGGQTRVMSSKLISRRRPRPSATSSPVASSTSGSAPSPASSSADSPPRDTSPSASTPSDSGTVPQNVSDAFAQVHPSLVEYLSVYPQGSTLAIIEPPPQQPFSLLSPTSSTSPPPSLSNVNYEAMDTNADTMTPASFPQYYGHNPHQPSQNMFQQNGVHPQDPLSYLGGSNLSSFNFADLGFTEEALMSDQFMSLMRQAGIFDQPNLTMPPLPGQPQAPPTNGFFPPTENVIF